jgi:hypothetical protein
VGEDANLAYDGAAANITANAALASAESKRLALIVEVSAVRRGTRGHGGRVGDDPSNVPQVSTARHGAWWPLEPPLPLVLTDDTNRD